MTFLKLFALIVPIIVFAPHRHEDPEHPGVFFREREETPAINSWVAVEFLMAFQPDPNREAIVPMNDGANREFAVDTTYLATIYLLKDKFQYSETLTLSQLMSENSSKSVEEVLTTRNSYDWKSLITFFREDQQNDCDLGLIGFKSDHAYPKITFGDLMSIIDSRDQNFRKLVEHSRDIYTSLGLPMDADRTQIKETLARACRNIQSINDPVLKGLQVGYDLSFSPRCPVKLPLSIRAEVISTKDVDSAISVFSGFITKVNDRNSILEICNALKSYEVQDPLKALNLESLGNKAAICDLKAKINANQNGLLTGHAHKWQKGNQAYLYVLLMKINQAEKPGRVGEFLAELISYVTPQSCLNIFSSAWHKKLERSAGKLLGNVGEVSESASSSSDPSNGRVHLALE